MRDKLLKYIGSGGRVCPMPTYWNELWQMLPSRRRTDRGSWEPGLPLILAAWWGTSALMKILRLAEHIKYAEAHGILYEVDQYLRELTPEQWAYGDGTTDWETYKQRIRLVNIDTGEDVQE